MPQAVILIRGNLFIYKIQHPLCSGINLSQAQFLTMS